MTDNVFNNFVKPLIFETQHLVGGVKRILTLPCESPVSIYVETLLPAVLGAWATVIEPDAKEVYHKVTGKSLVCDITAGGEALIVEGTLVPKPVTRFLFQGLKLYDIATWWFFLADVAEEGLVNWTTAIYNQRQCNQKGSPFYGTGPLYAGSLYGDGQLYEIDFAYAPPCVLAPVAPTQITMNPGDTATIAASARFALPAGPFVATNCQMRFIDTGIVFDEDDNSIGGDQSNRPNHVWGKAYNKTGDVQVLEVAWAWFGPGRPAQVFADEESAHCTMVLPSWY